MSKTIDSKLTNFYNSVKDQISNISNTTNRYIESLNTLISTNNEALSNINSSFKSTGIKNAINKVASVNEEINNIKKIFEVTISNNVSKSNNLVSKIAELNRLKEEISEIERKIQNTNSEEISTISNLKNTLASKNNTFDSKHSEALALYNELASVEDVSSEESYIPISTTTLGDLNFTTLENGWKTATAKFKASSGNIVEYVLYLPPNYDPSVKTPIVTYLHGTFEDGRTIKKVENTGISGNLKANNNNYTANTIVLQPLCKDKSWATSETVRSDLKELTDAVINTYNGDVTRNIISGNSMGGTGALYMAASYPGYYSDVVAFDAEYINKDNTGFASIEEFANALKDTNVISYWGSNDKNSNVSTNDIIKQLVDASGGSGNYESICMKGYGHGAISSKMVRKSTEFSDLILELIK